MGFIERKVIRTEEQLGHLHDRTANNNTQAQALRKRVLEAFDIAKVEVLDDRCIAFLDKAQWAVY